MSRWRIPAAMAVAVCALLAGGQVIAQTSDKADSGSAGAKSAGSASAQDGASDNGLPPPLIPKTEMPPEEDKTNEAPTYTFNPVQSQADVAIGDEYFKKGNYTAAASRYDSATKWNDGNAVAWRGLGEAQQKKSNAKAAREAYQKYLELAPDAKDAAEIKKRIAKLKG